MPKLNSGSRRRFFSARLNAFVQDFANMKGELSTKEYNLGRVMFHANIIKMELATPNLPIIK
jgi:hypothetical protein